MQVSHLARHMVVPTVLTMLSPCSASICSLRPLQAKFQLTLSVQAIAMGPAVNGLRLQQYNCYRGQRIVFILCRVHVSMCPWVRWQTAFVVVQLGKRRDIRWRCSVSRKPRDGWCPVWWQYTPCTTYPHITVYLRQALQGTQRFIHGEEGYNGEELDAPPSHKHMKCKPRLDF